MIGTPRLQRGKRLGATWSGSPAFHVPLTGPMERQVDGASEETETQHED